MSGDWSDRGGDRRAARERIGRLQECHRIPYGDLGIGG
jgi:hypothetical protein